MGDAFPLQYAENSGAFLGLGSMMPAGIRSWIFIGVNGIRLAGLLVFVLFRRNRQLGKVIGLSLLIAGGSGNLIDRTFNDGAVIDFMNLGMGSLRTGIFNVADVAVMIGAIMLAWPNLRRRQS